MSSAQEASSTDAVRLQDLEGAKLLVMGCGGGDEAACNVIAELTGEGRVLVEPER